MRHLFALLTLLVGLTAMAEPGQASNMGERSQLATHSLDARGQQSESERVRRCIINPRICADRAKPRQRRKKVRIYIPTVQFGSDRAFE